MDKKAAKICLGIVLLVGIVIAIINRNLVLTELQNFLRWVQNTGPLGPLALGLAYIIATIFFLPGVILTLAAGFVFGVIKGTIIVSIASTLGAACAFLLGRTLLREMIESRISGNKKFSAIDGAVGREGLKIVMLVRLSPVFPFNLLNYGLGLTKVSFKDYFFGSWIGMFPATVMYVYFGSALGSLADVAAGKVEGGAGGQVLLWAGLAATVVVTVFITRIAQKALREAVPAEKLEPEA